MDHVRIGFIGVGGIAEHHLGMLKRVEHADIAAVYDINQERSKQMAESYGAESFGSVDALLDSGKVDAVFVCTPPFAREGIEEAIARRGIHLFVEKPVGLDIEAARRKSGIIREAGVINSSGYCLRYMDIVEQAKQYLAGKKADLVMAARFGGMPGVRWWRMMEQSGGQLVEQSTHQLDLIRYLVGEFREVQAYHEQRHIREIDPEATAYDVGTVSFVLQSGAVGNITSTCLANYGGRSDVEIFGHDFYVSINGSTLKIIDAQRNTTVTSEVDFYYEQDRAFVEAVRTGNQALVLCSYADAVETLEVTLAANVSAESKQRVALPLVGGAAVC